MGDENVRKILNNYGLTEKEADIYIFIAKNGVQRSGEIAKGIKTQEPKSTEYWILQTKNVVHKTLESPTRFSAVPFETIVDYLSKPNTRKQPHRASSLINVSIA